MSLISVVQQSDLVLLILFGFIYFCLQCNFFIYIFKPFILYWGIADQGFPCDLDNKESACNVGDPGSVPGLGRPHGEGNGNPFQYSCLKTSMDRELGRLQSTGSQRV